MPKVIKQKQRKPSYFRPDASSTSVEYWRRMYYSANSARKEGWKRYYEELESANRGMQIIRYITRETPAAIPEHIKAEYRRMVSQMDESKRECAICMEVMTFEASELTECGHMFHSACLSAALERHAVCPLCRNENPMRKHCTSITKPN